MASSPYTASDFSSLPKAALDALGVRHIGSTTHSTSIHAGDEGIYPATHDIAAALLIGMVAARCGEFTIRRSGENTFSAFVDRTGWTDQQQEKPATARAPTPLAAVMAAYAKAVMA